MVEERHRNGAAPGEIRRSRTRGEHSARWRDIDREMQETTRRLRQTCELFVSEWDTLIEALAKRDLIPLLNSRGIEVDYVSRHHERNYGGRRWDIDIVTVNSRQVLAVLARTTLKRDGVDGFRPRTFGRGVRSSGTEARS